MGATQQVLASYGGGALEMTFTFTSLTNSGAEVFEFYVNDVLVDTKSPDVTGEIVFTQSFVSGSNIKIKCTQLNNSDSSLYLFNQAFPGPTVTAASYTTPDVLTGNVALAPFEWTYTNVTDGTGATIQLFIFDAQALANLVNNLDASAETGYVNGDLVTTWVNQTGGTNATSSGAARGVYSTGWSNGLPALSFAGAQYYDQSLTGYTGGGYTVLFVCELTTASASHRGLLFGPSFNPYLTVFGTLPKIYGFNGVLLSSTAQFSLARPAIVGMRVTPTGKKLFHNLTAVKSDNSGNTNLSVANITHPSFPWSGKIAQVLMVSDDLDDTNMELAIRTLEAKWDASSRFIVCDGDSLTRGQGSTSGTGYPTMMQSSLGDTALVVNLGVDSQTLANMISDGVAQIDTPYASALTRKNICVAWGGTNDLYFGASAATTITRFSDYCSARKTAGLKVIACTIIDRTPAGGSWTAADALTVNTSIRANYETYADVLCDLAADSRLSDCTNLTYFQADQVHLTDAGYAVVAELVEAAVNTIIAANP